LNEFGGLRPALGPSKQTALDVNASNLVMVGRDRGRAAARQLRTSV